MSSPGFRKNQLVVTLAMVCRLKTVALFINPFDSKGNYSDTSNNMNLVHWPLMGGLLYLVQRGGAWTGCGFNVVI